jgi:serine/threonine-protein kinase RsbW
MTEASFTFPSELGQLSAMREFLDAACRSAWAVECDDDMLCELELAVQEAATNIIRHAYDGQPGLPIHMTVATDPDTARVTLRHHGRGFDPDAVPPPSFDGSRFGGFGLYLIAKLVDEVEYTRDSDGRFGIRLLKRRHAARANVGSEGGPQCN